MPAGERARVALVTGGSRGIGQAICRRLARDGAAVLVAARSEEDCVRVAAEIRAEGGQAWSLGLDVTDEVSVQVALADARELASEVGPIDWLVNNAGIAESAPLLSAEGPAQDDALYERHLAVNFHGARRVVRGLLPALVERGYGRIVNVASSAGLRGYAYVAAYCASKFALVGYTLAAAEELRESGVTVNAVAPHYVDTPMLERSIERIVEKTERSPEQVRESLMRQNPGGRFVTPEEVADAVAGLLQGDATGLIVELDGSAPRIVGLGQPSAVSG